MTAYIARLTDANLSEPIYWRALSVQECIEVVRNRGTWQTSPDATSEEIIANRGVMILLSEPSVDLVEDHPPFTVHDDLAERARDVYPTHTITIGPRGGIRVDRH